MMTTDEQEAAAREWFHDQGGTTRELGEGYTRVWFMDDGRLLQSYYAKGTFPFIRLKESFLANGGAAHVQHKRENTPCPSDCKTCAEIAESRK